jgi:hypothetical protein
VTFGEVLVKLDGVRWCWSERISNVRSESDSSIGAGGARCEVIRGNACHLTTSDTPRVVEDCEKLHKPLQLQLVPHVIAMEMTRAHLNNGRK